MTFDDLFLTNEEEEQYQLEKLEGRFIISREEMMRRTYKDYVDALEKARYNLAIYKQLREVRD